jgi:hypothetical protein
MVENNGKINGGHIGKNYGKPWKMVETQWENDGKNRNTW